MQHDNTYDDHARNRADHAGDTAPAREPAASAKTFGMILAWVLIGLAGFAIASGLLALIVTLWRVIL